jgi:nickel transport protein
MRLDDNNLNRLINDKSKFVYFIFVISLFVFFRAPALAHKVTIFAWVEGDHIHTQSKFSDGKRIRGGDVVVFDLKGTHLLKGVTDENGMFSFKIPQMTELKIVLETSMGHAAVWTIPAKELPGSDIGSSISSIVKKNTVGTDAGSKHIKEDGKVAELATVKLEREEIQEIIDTSLDRKLAPIIDMMAKTYDQGPRLTEIAGGIGYIFGLVGLALYFLNRRRKE